MFISWRNGFGTTATNSLFKWIFVGVAGLTLLFGGIAIYERDRSRRLHETIVRGDQIVSALERYHKEHDGYPKALAELVPQYLPAVPEATWGLRRWVYFANADEIDFGVDETETARNGYHHWLRYMGKKSGWQTGD